MTFLPLGNSHVVVSVSIDFPSNPQWDAPFHRIADDYSIDWDGYAPWEDIFKLGAFAAVSELCEWVQVGIDVYIISLIKNIRSSFTHIRT